MSDFAKFKAAIELMAKCVETANDFQEVALKLLAKRDNPFAHFDFEQYGGSVMNTLDAGMESVMDSVSPENGHD